MEVEILGPEGNVHYRRPHDHKDVREAFGAVAYSVRIAADATLRRLTIFEASSLLGDNSCRLEISDGGLVMRAIEGRIDDAMDMLDWIANPAIECPACSRAGGAGMAVKHQPPVCAD